MKYKKRLPRKPLEDALFLIHTAKELVLRLYHSSTYMADECDFDLLEEIGDSCEYTALIASYTEIRQRQRARGEPEAELPEAPKGET